MKCIKISLRKKWWWLEDTGWQRNVRSFFILKFKAECIMLHSPSRCIIHRQGFEITMWKRNYPLPIKKKYIYFVPLEAPTPQFLRFDLIFISTP
jgi:hypothetical protein